MLNTELWTSFDKKLNLSDIDQIERRLYFLRDILEDAIVQFGVEDVSSEIDLNLHIYLNYFEFSGATKLTPWLIHASWFNYYSDGVGGSPVLLSRLKDAFLLPGEDLHSNLVGFLACTNLNHMIVVEADAVIWLSFLDHMAAKILFFIGKRRMSALFNKG